MLFYAKVTRALNDPNRIIDIELLCYPNTRRPMPCSFKNIEGEGWFKREILRRLPHQASFWLGGYSKAEWSGRKEINQQNPEARASEAYEKSVWLNPIFRASLPIDQEPDKQELMLVDIDFEIAGEWITRKLARKACSKIQAFFMGPDVVTTSELQNPQQRFLPAGQIPETQALAAGSNIPIKLKLSTKPANSGFFEKAQAFICGAKPKIKYPDWMRSKKYLEREQAWVDTIKKPVKEEEEMLRAQSSSSLHPPLSACLSSLQRSLTSELSDTPALGDETGLDKVSSGLDYLQRMQTTNSNGRDQGSSDANAVSVGDQARRRRQMPYMSTNRS